MKIKTLISLSSIIFLCGCETLQSPQQRRQANARQQASARHTEELARRLQAQVESLESENVQLAQEIQQLRADIRSVSGSVNSLESKQAREMKELIKRVEALLKKSMASRPSSSGPTYSGPGREHVVQSGHTLSAIAQAYGTTVKAIKQANNLKSDNIRVGQKLFIPE